MREVELQVWRILAVVEVGCMACIAGGRRSFEVVVEVTGRTWQCAVRAGKCISGYAQVIELGVEPSAHGVA